MSRSTVSALILGIVAFGGSGVARAQAVPWSYVEAGYSVIDVDSLDEKGSGWFGGVSFAGKAYHVFGRYETNTTDDSDTDLDRWYAGAGVFGPVGNGADAFLDVAYVDVDAAGRSQSGYFARAGVRYRVAKPVELGGSYRYESVGDFGHESAYEINATFYVSRLGIGLGWEKTDDVETYNAFLRWVL